MELSDYLTVIVPLNSMEQEVYRDIIVSCGLNEPVVVDTGKHISKLGNEYFMNLESVAKEVAATVGNKKSIIIGHNHSNIAFCYPDVSLVTFDSHNDSLPFDSWEFGDGYFLNKRQKDTYILGCNVKSNLPRVKNYPPRKVDRILEVALPKNIFLSLDIDVFNLSVTKAHGYTGVHHSIMQDVARAFGHEFHLSFQKVLDLSLGIVEGMVESRNVVGINIAQYSPRLEGEPYPTADILKQYLGIVIDQVNNQKTYF